MTKTIAIEVDRVRTAQRMSAQKLADRTSELGMEVARNTIANLENGRRTTVTVGELLLLAAALGVPPISLVVPTGQAEVAELLPGRAIPIDRARLWVDGTQGLDDLARQEDLDRLKRFREHDRRKDELRAALARFGAATGLPDEDLWARARRVEQLEARRVMKEALEALNDVPEDDAAAETTAGEASALDAAKAAYDAAVEVFQSERAVQSAYRDLAAVRMEMREVGEFPPPLPLELAWVDDEVADDA